MRRGCEHPRLRRSPRPGSAAHGPLPKLGSGNRDAVRRDDLGLDGLRTLEAVAELGDERVDHLLDVMLGDGIDVCVHPASLHAAVLAMWWRSRVDVARLKPLSGVPITLERTSSRRIENRMAKNNATKKPSARRYRDVRTGRFVTKKYAKKHPKRTVKEKALA